MIVNVLADKLVRSRTDFAPAAVTRFAPVSESNCDARKRTWERFL